MCGIAGVFSVTEARHGRRLVEAATALQACRGPDHVGVTSLRGALAFLVMGHCRLMIVDRTPGAHQPLWDHAESLCLVFNGEIYNHVELRAELSERGHRFETRSDSEVILEAFKEWGVASFERLNGMFAFGLYDRLGERVYLVRDRFGVKPLYYLVEPERLCFASTAEALARPLRLRPDSEYLSRGLQYWVYDDEDRSPFEGVLGLAPGHYAETSVGGDGELVMRIHPYYSLADRIPRAIAEMERASEDDLKDRLSSLIHRSVAMRLRADVPIGVSLSGGLDSSTVAALALRHGRPVGFTFGDPDDAATEGRAAALMSRHSSLEVRFVRPSIAEIARAYFACIEAQGAPFPTGSIVGQYLVYQAAREAGIRVMLGGQGSDEIFMGYRKYQYFHLRHLLQRRRAGRALEFAISILPEMLAEVPRAASWWKYRHRYTREGGISSGLRLPPPEPLDLGADPRRPLWERQVRDVLQTSLPTLLRYEDRNSMAHAIESRLPFLDHPLVEFALALGVSLKLREGMRKWIVREFARGMIPEATRAMRIKRGFDVQQDRWIAGGLGQAIRGALLERERSIADYLAPGVRCETYFSDARLMESPSAFTEATTLIWLGNQAAI